MSGSDLLQALSRLDLAISHAEAACAALGTGASKGGAIRNDKARQAIAELDRLIAELKSGNYG